jgi:hypothetical protein
MCVEDWILIRPSYNPAQLKFARKCCPLGVPDRSEMSVKDMLTALSSNGFRPEYGLLL